ncbi:hypothetical protein HU200_062233 [Digitaria exilis]|uniref:F-box domain-containing protein n=1 Tax=Digitaria exilis TaxID=1010633 RepID=A0A835A7A2_9POAL|nr:hypothetical protein HU200_062233 [Digitaria exilis]
MGAKKTRLKEEESGGLLQEQPLGPDLISRLPDEVLGDIISLLSTGEGARTQAISRRWRPLWRAAPLNLEVGDYPRRKSKRAALVTKILSEHAGPGRCFNLYGLCLHDRYAMVDGWLRSKSLTGLQEIDFSGADFSESRRPQPMPPSALLFAATLRFAWFSCCDFPEMKALSLTTSMRTVKILALESLEPNLDSVVDFLKCFPCVEKLYLTCNLQKTMKNERAYNPLDPIECLEVHLKKVVVNNYRGLRPEVDFAKFFVLNAKVLKGMEFAALTSCNDKWMASQHRRLQLDKRASPGARFLLEHAYRGISIPSFHMVDPFQWVWQDKLNSVWHKELNREFD